MRKLLVAFSLAVLFGSTPITAAEAFPGDGYPGPSAHGPRDPAGARPGYWRRYYHNRAMRRYRNNPGAQYELQQNRRRRCRANPAVC